MGLDCYVNVKTTGEAGKEEVQEIWYGRKENEIHGWMQRHSGVPADDFNCVELPLTKEIIDLFEEDMKKGALVPTSGFFFGPTNDVQSVVATATNLINAVREALTNNQEPYYYSWW